MIHDCVKVTLYYLLEQVQVQGLTKYCSQGHQVNSLFFPTQVQTGLKQL
jgi:hypothetical protein